MATKSFLKTEEIQKATQILRAPCLVPNGDVEQNLFFPNAEFSAWLSLTLEARLREHPLFEKAHPIALGSWARGELCPKSDIDVLFCGDESAVREVVGEFERQGLKLRYRMPENFDDWMIGVEPFDVLALLGARPLTAQGAQLLEAQHEKIKKRDLRFRVKLVAAMLKERREREVRFDSVSNYLEPNLKYGPGGLRDLQQAQIVAELFSDRFNFDDHAFRVFAYYRDFFLTIRQKLQLGGGLDLLLAQEQHDLSDWLGFAEPKAFMKEVQRGLSRVSFYADWVIEQALSSDKKIKMIQSQSLKTPSDCFLALRNYPSLLMQNRVRQSQHSIFPKLSVRTKSKVWRQVGNLIYDQLRADSADHLTVSFFRSRLIDRCVPDFVPLVGHVQHDQYHRYTADAHIMQTLREMKRLHAKPKLAGRLAPMLKALSEAEWRVLMWTCLYHDLAKGRGGDHSQLGVRIAERDLRRFGVSEAIVNDVLWLIENHLAMSIAAFRKNPRDPKTWQSLAEIGAHHRRIDLLAAFTIIDIRGTNPEAWTDWKERLLSELVSALNSDQVSPLLEFWQSVQKKKINLSQEFLQSMDSYLVETLPRSVLIQDLSGWVKACGSSKDESWSNISVVSGARGTLWVRFASRKDRPGLFADFVRDLGSIGCSVLHASIQTESVYGAYDWVQVKSSRTAKQVAGILASMLSRRAELEAREPSESPAQEARREANVAKSIRFDAIDLIAHDQEEWIFAFRGRDQSGALLAAAEALVAHGLSIRWAKVHTWGRQIEDIFSVQPLAHETAEATAKKLAVLTKQN